MNGLTIAVRNSVFAGNAPLFRLSDQVAGYGDVIEANGGYKSASLSLTGEELAWEDWFENGLARDITVYDDAHQVIFEGFVNQVGLRLGGRSLERGPLMDIANRVSVVYSTVDTSTDPPTMGNRAVTAVVNDTASQAKYGILEEIYSVSGCTAVDAVAIRDTFLAEHKQPETSESLDISGSSNPSIDLGILGYGAYLDKYTYTSTGTGTTPLSTRLAAVIAADPNGLFRTSIASNTLAVPAYDSDGRRAREILDSLVSMGDAASNRYTLGVYKNRTVTYAQVPTNFDYQFRLSKGTLETFGGGKIHPWTVLPGKWLFYPDFLPGRGTPPASALRGDPRALFIESVSFSAPYGLSINGGKVRRLPSLLAKLGLGGGV